MKSGKESIEHTFTPQSHENLLKSHLKSDSANQNRLQNELKKEHDRSERLRRALERAFQDLQEKNAQLESLNKELKPQSPVPEKTLPFSGNKDDSFWPDDYQDLPDEITEHFNVIIQQFHDLLDEKNKIIEELQNVKQPARKKLPTREIATQSKAVDEEALKQQMMVDFSNQVAHIKKEHKLVENVLTDKKQNLESIVDDLKDRLDQYEDEARKLQEELNAIENQRSEKAQRLIKDKDIENSRMKKTVLNLERQIKTFPDREKLLNEILHLVNEKDNIANKIDEIVKQLTTDSPNDENLPEIVDKYETMVRNFNLADDELDALVDHLKSLDQDKMSNKSSIIQNLQQIQSQHENEILALKSQINCTERENIPTKRPKDSFELAYGPKSSSYSYYRPKYGLPEFYKGPVVSDQINDNSNLPNNTTTTQTTTPDEPTALLALSGPPPELVHTYQQTEPSLDTQVPQVNNNLLPGQFVKCEHFWAKPRYTKTKVGMRPKVVHHVIDSNDTVS